MTGPETGTVDAGEVEALADIRQRHVQAIGAGLSRRDWHATETAYNGLRDAMGGLIRRLNQRARLNPAPPARAAAEGAAPEGWRLVPIEPTDEMIAAWPHFNKGAGHERAIYTAMLTAAPAPALVSEPVYKAVERILDEESAWVARPNDEVTRRIALCATIAALGILEKQTEEQCGHCMWDQAKPCTCGGGSCEQVDFGGAAPAPALVPPAAEGEAVAEAWRWTCAGDSMQFMRLSGTPLDVQGDIVAVRPLYPHPPAKPLAPMSTSGEMVEIGAPPLWKSGKWGDGSTPDGMAMIFCDAWGVTVAGPMLEGDAERIAEAHNATISEAASHLEALEALVAEKEERNSILTALTRTPLYSHRALTAKLHEIIATRFGARFMDPPDGGDVPAIEQVERMADALLTAEAALTKEGWRLVPVEPTPEMITAAIGPDDSAIFGGRALASMSMKARYAAMIAASPTPAGVSVPVEGDLCAHPLGSGQKP